MSSYHYKKSTQVSFAPKMHTVEICATRNWIWTIYIWIWMAKLE